MSVAESDRGEMTFPDTPAGRTAAAFMRLLVTSADEIVFEEMDALYHPDLLARWPHEEDEIRRERWQRHQARGGGFQLAAVDVTSSFEIVPIIEYADGRRFKIALAIEEHPPHRIVDERWDQVFDFAVLVREATDADGPALAQLDRLAPIVQGEARVTFDRGDDYFADARLIEHVIVGLAEVDGAVAAVNWGAVHRPLIGGVERRLATALHLRVHPEHQGKGLWGAVNTKLWDFFQKHETETSYTEPMAVGVHAVNRSRIKQGETAIVLGAGPVGLACISALARMGIEPIVAADLSRKRRELAAVMGAHEVVDPRDEPAIEAWRRLGGTVASGTPRAPGSLVTFEAVGVPGVIDQAMRDAPRGGRVLVVGACMEPDTMRPIVGIYKELEIGFALGYDPFEFGSTLRAIAEGEIDVTPMITGHVGIAGVPDAFEQLASPDEHCKILVEPALG